MSFWSATKLLLTLHCEESTELMSIERERDLSWIERWAVRMHSVACRQCRRFQRQLRFLEKAGRQRAEAPCDSPLPPHVRDQILVQIFPPDGKRT